MWVQVPLWARRIFHFANLASAPRSWWKSDANEINHDIHLANTRFQIKARQKKYGCRLQWYITVNVSFKLQFNDIFVCITQPGVFYFKVKTTFSRHGCFKPYLIIVVYSYLVSFLKHKPTNLCPRNYVPTNCTQFHESTKIGPNENKRFHSIVWVIRSWFVIYCLLLLTS